MSKNNVKEGGHNPTPEDAVPPPPPPAPPSPPCRCGRSREEFRVMVYRVIGSMDEVPLGYLTEREHELMESFADRCRATMLKRAEELLGGE